MQLFDGFGYQELRIRISYESIYLEVDDAWHPPLAVNRQGSACIFALMHIHHALSISQAGKRGRGVFTLEALGADTVIETSPVIVLSAAQRSLADKTILHDYIFTWGAQEDEAAVGLGYISLYNHASPSNCEYIMNFEQQTISIITMRAIEAGEELTINYSTTWNEFKSVWFDAE